MQIFLGFIDICWIYGIYIGTTISLLCCIGTGNDTNFTLDEQVQMAYQYEDYSRINALLDMNNEEFSSIKRVLKGKKYSILHFYIR